MFKTFIPLNSTQSPTRNPYEVRTFMGETFKEREWRPETCVYERDCNIPPNSTIAQVLTLEDEIRRIHHRTKENIFLKKPKQKCSDEDEYYQCVMRRRTPSELKRHAVARERYLKVKDRMSQFLYDMQDLYADHASLVQMDSPIGSEAGEEEGFEEYEQMAENEGDDEVKPEPASPACSMNIIYLPTQRMLDLKRPKSGILINESAPPNFPLNDEVPYTSYNPRILQQQFDQQGLQRIDLIEGPQNDYWTWNIGLQRETDDLDKVFVEAAAAPFDCGNADLIHFKLPTDLDKTFSAGVVFGNKAVQLEPPKKKQSYYNRPKEIACLFVAFVEGFRLNADFWTAETMDNIINMGEKLITKSIKMNYKSPNNNYDIIPEITEREALINIKIHFTGPLKSEPNIYKALSLYFSKFNACILCSNNLYLLIWKRCKNFFFIYDPNGRGENCERDFENGKCALMSTHFVEHLVYLIVHISATDLNDEFTLYGILLENYGKIVNPINASDFPKRTRKMWAVINETYALIPSCNYGLTQPNTVQEPNPSMMISVMALLYNHIEKPKTWDTNTIDQLIRMGTAYDKSLRKSLKMKDKDHLNIMDLLEKYVLGYYKASLKKKPFFYTGTVTDYCKKFSDSLLAHGIKELFLSEWEAALVQIDNSVVAVWRDETFYYVFDSFKRGKSGQVLDADDYKTDGAADLQLHSSFDSMVQVLYHNALKMRRGGKFFIHGITVGCIKPIMDGKPRKLRYTGLKLTLENFERQNGGDDNTNAADVNDKKKGKGKKKPKKEHRSKHPHNVCSIHTIPEEDRIVDFDSADVVDTVLDDIICEIIQELPEGPYGLSRIYKCANRVLLRSDKDYLESMKYILKHGRDYDNYNVAFQTQPDPNEGRITLKQELALNSNFQNLPDGSWIIFGRQVLPRVDDEQEKLRGFLSALTAAALTSKYKISTWNSKLIDSAIEATDYFGEEFQMYQYALGAFFSKKIPRINIGKRFYVIIPEKIMKSNMQKSLRQVLLDNLVNFNRMMVICQRFCCLIIKRYNFLYMYIGFPVNAVGYRKIKTGPACLLRFVELDSLMQRIEYGCNPMGCEITQYVLVALKVHDTTPEPMGRYKYWPPNIEQRLYNVELADYKKNEERKLYKMRFLDSELEKENKRIREFMAHKHKKKGRSTTVDDDGKRKKKIRVHREGEVDEEGEEEDLEYFDDEEIEEGEEEDLCDIKPKHQFGKSLAKLKEEPPRAVAYGYKLREKDLLFKIQGSKAIDGRSECVLDKIKPCFFASTLAILYTIMRPLNEWNTQRVDQVINNAVALVERVDDMSTAYERIVKHINVDDYVFNIVISVYDPLGMGSTLPTQLKRATNARKYILLHTANCTYAIFRDKYYHLFDPYPSMEKTGNDEVEENGEEAEEEISTKTKIKLPKGTKKYGERNTASWVLFVDMESMINYMDERSCSSTWKEDLEYTFHVVDVSSYRKAKQNARVLNLLTGMTPCDTSDNIKELSRCAYNESIAWLDHCLPVWSRLNRRNAAGHYRGQGVSKHKKYNIEIKDRLWSLWGNLHPGAAVFDARSRNKQFLACCILALCAANVYRLTEWSPQLLDSIVINGDRYHRQSLDNIKCVDYEFSVEDLNIECWLDRIHFDVHIENVIYGKLYVQPSYDRMNLAEALMYFFNYYSFGILQCFRKCLAIGYIPGHDGGYFMYDCQSNDHPLYPKGQGASYILRTKHLQVLLYCIIVTLNVPYYNVLFTIHKVDILPEGASVEGTDNNAEEQEQQQQQQEKEE